VRSGFHGLPSKPVFPEEHRTAKKAEKMQQHPLWKEYSISPLHLNEKLPTGTQSQTTTGHLNE
jgi:hypothetical protein